MKKSIMTKVLLILAVAMLPGCGSGGGTGAGTTTTAVTGEVTGVGTDGVVASETTVAAPADTSVTIAAKTTLTDANGAPVTGTISTSVECSTLAADLPAAAPAGKSLAVFLDISMGSVKHFSTPMTVKVTVPSELTSVDVYSFDGSNWNLEQAGVPVVNGKATLSVGHLSCWACFASTATGTGTGTGTGSGSGSGAGSQ